MTDPKLLRRIRSLCQPRAPQPTSVGPLLGRIDGIRAVLFDVYGTLLISASGDIGVDGTQRGGQGGDQNGGRDRAGATAVALNGLLDAVGLGHAATIEAAADANLGQRLAMLIQAEHAGARALGIRDPEVDILKVWQSLLGELGLEPSSMELARIALEYECRVNPVWPMPGSAELLATLRERGLVLGIVSNAQFYTPLILEALLGQAPTELGLDPHCSAWSYQVGEAKPSTAIYRVALQGLARAHRIRPEQVLYVGNDRRKDIGPARRLGLRTALFAGDARSLRLYEDDPGLAGVSADRITTELSQLLNIIG